MGFINSGSESFLKRIFGDDLELQCYACGKKFKDKNEFMKHEHSEEKPS